MKHFTLHVVLSLLSVGAALAGEPAPLQHRFLAVDESRGQLVYVDQSAPEKNWTIKLPVKSRDCQLIGGNRILLSGLDGYYVYDLQTRSLVREFHHPSLSGTCSVRRLPDGHTLVACNQKGIQIFDLDANDAIARQVSFPTLNTLRLMRRTPQGTLLMGANQNSLAEVDLDGRILRLIALPVTAKHVYQILRLPNGNDFAASGYGHSLIEVDPTGKVVQEIRPPDSTPQNEFKFFAGFQRLKNGHIVQCNWTGHGSNDSARGVQLIEWDEAGKVVWTWHNPELAGTIHGVILLDDLDVSVLNDDTSGTLESVETKKL